MALNFRWILRNLRSAWTSSSLKLWKGRVVNPSRHKILFLGRLLTSVSISLLVVSLFTCVISSWFHFGRLYHFLNYVFLLDSLMLCIKLFIVLMCDLLNIWSFELAVLVSYFWFMFQFIRLFFFTLFLLESS